MDHNYVDQEWFLYLTHPMQDLVVQAFGLLSREKEQNNGYHDYSFVVFPLAKAYEGFLKKVLVEMGLSDKETVYGRHFRIGKSLNPDLPKNTMSRHRDRRQTRTTHCFQNLLKPPHK